MKATPFLIALTGIVLFLGASCVTGPVTYPASDTLLPGTIPAMNTPGYWLDKTTEPDTVLVDQTGIALYNAQVQDKKLVRNLAVWVPPAGEEFRKELSGNIGWIAKQDIYQPRGTKVDTTFLAPLEANMDLAAIPDQIEPRWAFVVKQADLRVLPTREGLFDGPFDYFIDNLQASSLEPGDACVIQHRSRDGLWYYVTTRFASGWMECADLATTDRDTFLAMTALGTPVVVTAAKADMYADATLSRHRGYLRMGTTLRPAPDAPTPSALAVLVPGRNENGELVEETRWIALDEVHYGYLPCTRRTALRQAFKALNAPYGWGGMFGEQDCSQYLQEIFATMGFCLPRNSAAQAKTGTPIPGFSKDTANADKLQLLATQGIPGFTIMRLPGHIMLFLGVLEGKAYAIHATWAYREVTDNKDRIRLINRVTVSTLDLGAGSTKGSLLERLTVASTMAPLP